MEGGFRGSGSQSEATQTRDVTQHEREVLLVSLCARQSACLRPSASLRTRLSERRVDDMAAVLEEVDEAELIHVALVRRSAGACLRGHLKKSARAVALKPLNTNR